MEYELIRSGRRTLALEVRTDGTLVVRAPYLCSEKKIEGFLTAHTDWIEKARRRVAARAEAHPEPTEEEIKRLKKAAREQLPPKVAHYAALLGVQPTAVRITSARTRFGSCSGKNAISFSWRLMQYPDEAVDYVVVHELCHILHHDHSPRFYEQVARVLPDYKARAKILKK